MTVSGRKLVGSALRRGRRGFLQHGSVLRGEEHLELCSFVAGLSTPERQAGSAALARKTCTLGSIGADAVDETALGSELARNLGEACKLPTRRVPDFEALTSS